MFDYAIRGFLQVQRDKRTKPRPEFQDPAKPQRLVDFAISFPQVSRSEELSDHGNYIHAISPCSCQLQPTSCFYLHRRIAVTAIEAKAITITSFSLVYIQLYLTCYIQADSPMTAPSPFTSQSVYCRRPQGPHLPHPHPTLVPGYYNERSNSRHGSMHSA